MRKYLYQTIVLSAVAVALGIVLFVKFSTPRYDFPMPQMGEVTIVEVGSTICEPCQLLRPEIEKIKTKLEGKVTVHIVEITNQSKDAYKIQLIPSVLVFDKNGQEVARKIFAKEDVPGTQEWLKEKTLPLGVEW
jgi:thiol-disulfide isomerase/thioredoxin